MNGYYAIRLTYCVRPKVRHDPLRRCFVFLICPLRGIAIAYFARSERIAVIMNRPPESKKAMPLGLVPYLGNLLPSARTVSWDTKFQVPKSCSVADIVIAVPPA
jgi:hypothetical protein